MTCVSGRGLEQRVRGTGVPDAVWMTRHAEPDDSLFEQVWLQVERIGLEKLEHDPLSLASLNSHLFC